MPSEKSKGRSGSSPRSNKPKARREKGAPKDSGSKSSKHRDDGSGSWFSRICACSDVALCGKKDQIPRKEKKEKKSKKEKKEKKAAENPEWPNYAEDGGANDDDSAETCTSYATESAYSRQSTARSIAESDGGSQSARQNKKNNAAPKKDLGAPVQVLNLADLAGQELPKDVLHHNNGGGGENRGDHSARSRQSEGGRSYRSDAQSEGGRSVASVSVKKYMGYLSEPKSPAEVKKLVKEFVRQMVKGREMNVMGADGQLKPVVCRLSRELDILKIKAGEQTRKVQLSDVERVLFGAADELNDLETPLDDCCATLELLGDGECISFKFSERKAAELYTLCMQLFIDGLKPQ